MDEAIKAKILELLDQHPVSTARKPRTSRATIDHDTVDLMAVTGLSMPPRPCRGPGHWTYASYA
jgi:hypothetical protein